MKIWVLDSERSVYETLSLNNREEDKKYVGDYEGQLITEWKEISFSTERKGKYSDIPDFISGIPILSEKAVQCLHHNLIHEQLLPVSYNGKRYFVINVTTVIDCIDYENAVPDRLRTGTLTGFKQYAFHPEKLNNVHIFKIPELPRTRVFVTDTFRNTVLESKLEGFRFREVWDSEANVVEQNKIQQENLERHLRRIEEMKGKEFPYIVAMQMVNDGKAIACGKHKLQTNRNGNIMLGTLQPDGTYAWIDPYAYPPIFHEWKWHIVDRHDI